MANEQFLIEPSFDDLGTSQVFEFNVGDTNLLAQSEFNEHFGLYQRLFGIFSYMRLNRLGKYVMHYMKSDIFMWQEHNSCSWDPMGGVRVDTKEVEPQRAKVNAENCYDEKFNSAFEQWLSWNGASISMDPRGVQATNMMVRYMLESATKGARAVMTAGKLFDGVNQDFVDNAPNSVTSAFTKTAQVVRGWIELLRNLGASGYTHLDTLPVVSGDLSTDTTEYEGDVLNLFDTMMGNAPAKLRRAHRRGGMGGFNSFNRPLWIVSDSIADAVAKAKTTQDGTTAQNDPRITVETVQAPTGRGGNAPLRIYYIDNTAVIPIEDVSLFDDYLKGTSHFAYLTVSGVIQLGGSFGAIPEARRNNVAMRIEQKNTNEELGKTTFLSHALFATAINDHEYISGGYKYFEPA